MLRRLVPKALCLALPALLFLGLYVRALDYAFVWTDHGAIEAEGLIVPADRIFEAFSKPMLPGLAGRAQAQPYYRPVQSVAASLIDHELGRRPRNFRALSLFAGLLSTLAFTLFAQRLSGSWPFALAAGAIAAAHPAGVEVYVWIAGLGQALSSLFTVANLWSGVVAMRWLAAGRRGPGLALALVSTGFLLLALGSKENAIVAPVLLLLCWTADRIRAGSGSAPPPRALSKRSLLAVLAPLRQRATVLVAVQLAVALWFALVLRPGVTGGVLTSLKPVAGSSVVQALTAVASWPATFSWLFLPLQSTTSDVVRLVGSVADLGFALGLGMLALSALLWLDLSRRGYAIAGLGLAWMWIAFAPTSGVVPLTHPRALRYVYPAVFGLALFLPAAAGVLLGRFDARTRRRVAALLAVLFVAGLAERTFARTPDWRTDLHLFQRDLARDPLYREGYHMLATALAREGRLAEARLQLAELLELAPRFRGYSSHLQDAEAIALYCNINVHLGQHADNLRFAETIQPGSPQWVRVPGYFYQCGARTLEAQGENERALELLKALIEVERGPERARYQVAAARNLERLGRDVEARAQLRRIPQHQLRDPGLFEEVRRLRAALGGGG